MKLSQTQQNALKQLPGVDRMLEIIQSEEEFAHTPKSVRVDSARLMIEKFRAQILSADPPHAPDTSYESMIMAAIKDEIRTKIRPNLRPVINATGVVVHTNLGRSLLAKEALDHIQTIASQYSNLEYNLDRGLRGSRYEIVESLLCEITGAPAAMVVNNNAAAVLLALESVASGKEVIVSRGELVEIGGSFRVPDIMAKSGCTLKEVGTTNRTHKRDYQNAIQAETGLLLKVHQSNFCVEGFTASVSLKDLVELGKQSDIPVMEDLGSGTFIDFSPYGLTPEPTVQASVKAGADVITFSGDKLLGGPQAGIILGTPTYIKQIQKNPLTRALRIDKLTLAALEATLRLYRDEEKAIRKIPTLNMLLTPFVAIQKKADLLAAALRRINDQNLKITFVEKTSRVGGGALPLQNLPSQCLGITIDGVSPNDIENFLRAQDPPIIGRIEDNLFLLDPRTLLDYEINIIANAFDTFKKQRK